MQYLVLIHNNADTSPSPKEWEAFIESAMASVMFQGGSEISANELIGSKPVTKTTNSVAGFMRFDSEDKESLLSMLQDHPVVRHGGSLELCEMPKS